MWLKFLDNIQRYLFFWVIGAITLGLLQVLYFGGYPFSPLICLLAALVMIYPSLVPLSFGNLKQAVKKYNIYNNKIILLHDDNIVNDAFTDLDSCNLDIIDRNEYLFYALTF